MERKHKWQNTELKPEESFEKGEYEALLEYVKENEHALMSAFFNADAPAFNHTLMYGSAKMNYLEQVIKDNPMFYVLFKLGELNGHLTVFNTIKYDEQHNNLAMKKFLDFKDEYSSFEHLPNEIIKELYEKGPMTFEKLTISSEKNAFNALHYLVMNDFVRPDVGSKYSLTDTGLRVAKQLK